MQCKTPDLINLEANAFALWKVEAPVAYKRRIIVELYGLIRGQLNATDVRLFTDLKHKFYNVTRTEFDCAVAILKEFNLVGTYPVGINEDEPVFHINRIRRRSAAWRKYVKQMQN